MIEIEIGLAETGFWDHCGSVHPGAEQFRKVVFQ
jgi:hypothetical protein